MDYSFEKANSHRSTTLFANNGKPVVTIQTDREGDLYAFKKVFFSRHALRKPKGLAMDWLILEEAKRLGVRYFRVLDRDSDTHVFATLEAFYKHGFDVARGHGRQVGLAFEHWTLYKPTDPTEATQHDLFGNSEAA